MSWTSNLTRLLSTSLLLLSASAPFSDADAFLLLTGKHYEKGERPVSAALIWPQRTLRFQVNTNLSALGGSNPLEFTGEELLQAVHEAANSWREACRADIRIEIVGTTNDVHNTEDRRNTIVFDRRKAHEGNYYGTETQTLASAVVTLTESEILDCDIVLNGNASSRFAFEPALSQADLRSVLTHEIGHCLGLDHPIELGLFDSSNPYVNQAAMRQSNTVGSPSDTSRRTISQDDRDGVECLYERGKPFRSGLYCSSYSGTNGQGPATGTLPGGPSVVDTACGGDFQGRNANPGTNSGDGCISSAFAETSPSRPFDPLDRLGSSTGFLFLAALYFCIRIVRRRWLRLRSGEKLLIALLASAPFFSTPNASAWELELGYGTRKSNPSHWNAFSGMHPGATAWDEGPSNERTKNARVLGAKAFTEDEAWGKWGAFFSLELPQSLKSSGKAASAASQSKTTSIQGFRVGPELRWFPLGKGTGLIQWFVGGRLGIGFFFGSQSFEGTEKAKLSYRSWASELALGTGAEIPLGKIKLTLEGGFSRVRSSYFASTGNSGSVYGDFPSGTRIGADTGSGHEDLKFKSSGFYGALALQIPFGRSKSTPVRDRTPEPQAEPKPESQEEPSEEISTEEPSTETAPEEAPVQESQDTEPTAPTEETQTPLETPLPFPSEVIQPEVPESEIAPPETQIEIEAQPETEPQLELSPDSRPRETWEIDAVPETGSLTPSESVPGETSPVESKASPDPVP